MPAKAEIAEMNKIWSESDVRLSNLHRNIVGAVDIFMAIFDSNLPIFSSVPNTILIVVERRRKGKLVEH